MTDRGMNVQNVERQEKPLDILRISARTVAVRWQARQGQKGVIRNENNNSILRVPGVQV